MPVRFAVEKLAAAAIGAESTGEEIAKISENEIGDLVLAIGNVQLDVIVSAAERESVPPAHPVVDRRTLIFVLKDSCVSKVRGRADSHFMTTVVRHKASR